MGATASQIQSAGIAGAASAAPVSARRVGKSINDRGILRDLSFEIAAGEYVALLGANGAGKTTLLKVLATLVPVSSGELRLFGQPAGKQGTMVRGQIGLIGHQAMLYRELSARENLVFFARLYGLTNAEQRSRELLNAVGLLERADDPVKAFSRGMTQRVSIARALLHDPQLLLADEPFAGLDVPSTLVVERLLAELHAAGKTIVLVNHDIAQSLRLSKRTMVLRQGRRVVDQASSELDVAGVLAVMGLGGTLVNGGLPPHPGPLARGGEGRDAGEGRAL